MHRRPIILQGLPTLPVGRQAQVGFALRWDRNAKVPFGFCNQQRNIVLPLAYLGFLGRAKKIITALALPIAIGAKPNIGAQGNGSM
jgi:hypothetical protein